jgi:Ca2+-binding EF-hand superfamily protein
MSSIGSVSGGNAAYYLMQKEMFTKTDANEDGSVSKSEYVSGRPKGMSEEDAAKAYSTIDTEGTGSISLEQFTSAASAAPESKLSGAAMDVLMQMGPQGGMMPPGGQADTSEMFSDLDADSDGSLTEAEFLAGKPDDMTDEQASALFDKIDSEGTGSVTEDQFAESMTKGPGGAPMGPPPGGNSEEDTEETFDTLDTNQDGVVSEAEFLAGKPEDVSDEQASTLFDALDTEGTGSITVEQFSDGLSQAGRPPMGPPPGGMNMTAELESLLSTTTEDTGTASV